VRALHGKFKTGELKKKIFPDPLKFSASHYFPHFLSSLSLSLSLSLQEFRGRIHRQKSYLISLFLFFNKENN
jgi:hypothetical protein